MISIRGKAGAYYLKDKMELEDNSLLAEMPWDDRAILLVDLDAFFASVEQLDHPSWKGEPVIVGGDPKKRGVVSTASYEARKYGVHSAMPSAQAERLCPNAHWSRGNFARYSEVSAQVMQILNDETPHVQQVSIDEAFIDVTPTRVNTEHPVSIAMRIQERVSKLGVSCSIGVATTKSIAKIASDMDKPNGITVVPSGTERTFLDPLPVRVLSGVGPSTEKKLHSVGIETLGQLAQADPKSIHSLLGKFGDTILARALCIEDDAIVTSEPIKSISSEFSFAESLSTRQDITAAISSMSSKVARRLRMKSKKAKTVTLKIRFDNLSFRTAQETLSHPTDDEYELDCAAYRLLDDIWYEGCALRLVGVSCSGFDAEDDIQMSLFDGIESNTSKDIDNRGTLTDDKRDRLNRATDLLRDKFGENSVIRGGDLRLKQNTTGSTPKNPADYR